MVCLSCLLQVCLPQILLGALVNTLPHLINVKFILCEPKVLEGRIICSFLFLQWQSNWRCWGKVAGESSSDKYKIKVRKSSIRAFYLFTAQVCNAQSNHRDEICLWIRGIPWIYFLCVVESPVTAIFQLRDHQTL